VNSAASGHCWCQSRCRSTPVPHGDRVIIALVIRFGSFIGFDCAAPRSGKETAGPVHDGAITKTLPSVLPTCTQQLRRHGNQALGRPSPPPPDCALRRRLQQGRGIPIHLPNRRFAVLEGGHAKLYQMVVYFAILQRCGSGIADAASFGQSTVRSLPFQRKNTAKTRADWRLIGCSLSQPLVKLSIRYAAGLARRSRNR
jgi:hypothetical protein